MCRVSRADFTPKGVSVTASNDYKHATTTWLFDVLKVVPTCATTS